MPVTVRDFIVENIVDPTSGQSGGGPASNVDVAGPLTNAPSAPTDLQTVLSEFDGAISAISGLTFLGLWDASTNTPTLVSGTGTAGDYYRVSVAGATNLDGITDWNVGDHLIFDDSGTGQWVKLDNTDQVVSVNSFQGVILLTATDIPFVTTGTPIVSTDVQGAIQELSEMLPGPAVSSAVYTFYVDPVGGDDSNDGESIGAQIKTGSRLKEIYDYVRSTKRDLTQINVYISSDGLSLVGTGWLSFENISFYGVATDIDSGLGILTGSWSSTKSRTGGIKFTVSSGTPFLIGDYQDQGWHVIDSSTDLETATNASVNRSIHKADSTTSIQVYGDGKGWTGDMVAPTWGSIKIVRPGVSILLPDGSEGDAYFNNVSMTNIRVSLPSTTSMTFYGNRLFVIGGSLAGRISFRDLFVDLRRSKLFVHGNQNEQFGAHILLSGSGFSGIESVSAPMIQPTLRGTIQFISLCGFDNLSYVKVEEGGSITGSLDAAAYLDNVGPFQDYTGDAVGYSHMTIDRIRWFGQLSAGSNYLIIADGACKAYWHPDNDVVLSDGITIAPVSMNGGSSALACNFNTNAHVYEHPDYETDYIATSPAVTPASHTHIASEITDFDTEVSNNTSVTTNTAKISADGSVATHSDVTNAGSGQIITSGERLRLPTSDEKNALVGTGTPSSSNPYVTDDDSRLSSVSDAAIRLFHGTTITEYATVALALAAAVSGDTVFLGPSSYDQGTSTLTIPNGVVLRGTASSNTIITGTTGNRIVISDNASLCKLAVNIPIDGNAAVLHSSIGFANINHVTLSGQGGVGSAGIRNTNGSLGIENIEYSGGVAGYAIDVTAGGISSSALNIWSGTLSSAVNVSGNGVFNYNSLGIADGVCTNGLSVDAGSVVGSGGYISGTSAIYISSDSAFVEIEGAKLRGSTYDLNVAAGIHDGTVNLIACSMSSEKVNFEEELFAGDNAILSYQDEKEGDPSFQFMSELLIGSPMKGYELVAGRGDSTPIGMVVFSTNNTAGATSDGANFIDLSSDAYSPSGSSFGFQTGVANEAIMFTSVFRDSHTADRLRFYNLKVKQVAAAVGGSWVLEIKTGASTWTEIGVQASHSEKMYRYGNDIFLRANSTEHFRFGIDQETTWPDLTINSITGRWMRIRCTSAPTVSPTFEQFKLGYSRTELNTDGPRTSFGLGMWKKELVGLGNIFGESGGVASTTIPVGSGGVPTGWNHSIKNSFLNGAGDAIYFQVPIPKGVCTAYPVTIEIDYIPTTGPAVTKPVFIISSYVGPKVGNFVADPSGGEIPIARTQANTHTLTASPGYTDTITLTEDTAGKVHTIQSTGHNISDYYEGDILFIRIEMDNDGSSNDNIVITTASVTGVQWTDGERL